MSFGFDLQDCPRCEENGYDEDCDLCGGEGEVDVEVAANHGDMDDREYEDD